MPRQKRNKESEAVRRMIHRHLRHNVGGAVVTASPPLSPVHLDEDALAAFVEGGLSEAESRGIVSHLVSCAACRRVAAQLIRLQSTFGEDEFVRDDAPSPERNRIRQLLDDLASRVLPESGDREVFAYHAPAEDFEAKEEKNVVEESENGDSKS